MGARKQTVPKRLRGIVKLARKHGWTYEVTSKNHPRLVPPKGWRLPASRPDGERPRPITFSLTPSDNRADLNSFAELRRAGLPVDKI